MFLMSGRSGCRRKLLLAGISLLVLFHNTVPAWAALARTLPTIQDASKGQGREAEFSADEFYSIKRSISNMKMRQSSATLRKAQEIGNKLYSSLPVAPSFYGQDHYEQTYDDKGGEVWTHVGRPDEFVYDMFFKTPSKYNGTFVEVGAADGVRSSNTLFFEESLGWNGLLIEGATENFLKLFANTRRKRSIKIYSAVCAEKGTTKFLGDGMAAGAIEDMTRHHIESWGQHFKSLSPYDVPCNTMAALTKSSHMPKTIDLMSLDIEGGEMRAIETFDWDSHQVRVLIIEPGRSCFPKRRSQNVCAELLKQKGFCLVARRAVNEFWTSDSKFKQSFCT